MAALFWVLVLGATLVTTFDAVRFSRDEYIAAFGQANLRVFFVGASLFILTCRAGIFTPFVCYYLWGRWQPERARLDRTLRTQGWRARRTVATGDTDQGVALFDASPHQAREWLTLACGEPCA